MGQEAPLGLYIHWPFCRSKCPYCDFNSHVVEAIDHSRWRRAYLRELASFAAETADRPVATVFFGGGTPSLMPPDLLADVLDAIRASWTTTADVEITLEANPNAVDAGRFRAFRDAGVNRLSIGVQSLDDDQLRFLGRSHAADEALRAIALSQAIFPRTSFDLIYALPGQSLDQWRRQLDEGLERAGEHLSLYQLTIERGTAFHRERLAAADEDTAADLFELTQEKMEAVGYPAYEISNHARPGAACRHNLDVWQGNDYLAIGPGAHGRLTQGGVTVALRQRRAPEVWLAEVEAKGTGLDQRIPLSNHERAEELLILGLRLASGVDRVRFGRLTGLDLASTIDTSSLDILTDAGLVEMTHQALKVTPRGRLFLNAVITRLVPGPDPSASAPASPAFRSSTDRVA